MRKSPRAADFGYRFEFFEDVAQEYGLVVNEVEGDHPLEHDLLRLSVVE